MHQASVEQAACPGLEVREGGVTARLDSIKPVDTSNSSCAGEGTTEGLQPDPLVVVKDSLGPVVQTIRASVANGAVIRRWCLAELLHPDQAVATLVVYRWCLGSAVGGHLASSVSEGCPRF